MGKINEIEGIVEESEEISDGEEEILEEVLEKSEEISDGEEEISEAIVVWRPVALVADRNPYLVYIGGLDRASQPTMTSIARRVAAVLSGGQIVDPSSFPWHFLSYGIVKRTRSLLREQGMAPRSINKALTLMRNVMKEAWLLKLLPHEAYQAAMQVENLESKRLPVGRVVERDEIADILLGCYGIYSDGERVPETIHGIRDAALICLLVGAGLREGEAVSLLRGDYDLEKGTIRVRQGKGHKQREAFLEQVLEGPILRLLVQVPGTVEDPLLPRIAPCGTVIRPLRKITTQAVHLVMQHRGMGRKPFTPHDLRRTFITSQLERGVDPIRLARAVGHASPKTTMIYDRRTAESDRLAIRGDKDAVEESQSERMRREKYFLAAMERLRILDVDEINVKI